MKFKFIKIINILLVLVIVVLLSFTFKENINSKENIEVTNLEFTNDKIRVKKGENVVLGVNISSKDIEVLFSKLLII